MGTCNFFGSSFKILTSTQCRNSVGWDFCFSYIFVFSTCSYKMFSLTDASGRRTALVALRNCLYLIPVGYLAYECEWNQQNFFAKEIFWRLIIYFAPIYCIWCLTCSLYVGGLTSGWFCLESSLLTLAIGGTALSFYFNRTTKNARRMFLASLLYLPVFMSGLMFHRLYDNWQSYLEDDSATLNIPSLGFLQENDSADSEKKEKNLSTGKQVRPPVAFASVAPFPFLPAPSYSHN